MSTPSPLAYFLWELSTPSSPRLVGELRRLNNGDVSLQYDTRWMERGYALSPDLPLTTQEYPAIHRRMREKAAPGAVDDARPDNWGEKVIRYLHKPRGNHLIDYLYFAGDDRFGALGVSSSSSSYVPFESPALPRLEDAPQISEAAKIIQGGGELSEQQRRLSQANASLGGAKPKAVIRIDAQEWVLKLFNGEPYDLPLIEHATMRLAQRCGITVAETMPVRLPTEHAVAVRRFDRVGDQRIHCISAATVLRAETPPGQHPDYGYPHLARAIRRSGDPATLTAQLLDLFRRMVFNILIANTDDHEKNHGFMTSIKGSGTVLTLAPAYDMVTTGNGAIDHEFLIGEDSPAPLLSNAMSVCAQFDLTPEQARNEIISIIGIVNGWQDHFSQYGISHGDILALAVFIDDADLLKQREAFPREPLAKPVPKKRAGPFSG
jgi:serine/threonine-protein kinase HipA